MPSGPEALAVLRAVSFFRTQNLVTVGGLVCCTLTDASRCRGEKKFIGERIASDAGVFRGARFSSFPTNACSTENNIPFPLFYLRVK